MLLLLLLDARFASFVSFGLCVCVLVYSVCFFLGIAAALRAQTAQTRHPAPSTVSGENCQLPCFHMTPLHSPNPSHLGYKLVPAVSSPASCLKLATRFHSALGVSLFYFFGRKLNGAATSSAACSLGFYGFCYPK